jgi:hypothetical protein
MLDLIDDRKKDALKKISWIREYLSGNISEKKFAQNLKVFLSDSKFLEELRHEGFTDADLKYLGDVASGKKRDAKKPEAVEPKYRDLALLSFLFNGYQNILLFDIAKFLELKREDEKLRKKDIYYFTNAKKKEIFILDDGGEPKQLDFFQCQWIERGVVVGFVNLKPPVNKYHYLGAFEIYRIAAKKGFGPLLFELVFAFAAKEKRPVIIDRGEVSADARKVWERFDSRSEIIAYPAALRKYPELVGFTGEEVIETFGAGIYHSATFDRFGLPDAIAGDKRKELMSKAFPGVPDRLYPRFSSRSYLDDEGKRSTNRVVGELAGLDKAFFYDGKVGLYDALLAKGDAVIEDRFMKIQMIESGLAFFNMLRPKDASTH